MAFAEVHSVGAAERGRWQRWQRDNAAVIDYRPEEQLGFDFDGDAASVTREEDAEEDVIPQELLEAVTELPREEYDIGRIEGHGQSAADLQNTGHRRRQAFRPDDDYNLLREFNASYEGTRSAVEDMHLEYQRLLRDDHGLADRLNGMPGAVFSGRRKLKRGARGVFLCYSLPALDAERGEFTLDAGPTRWYLYDVDSAAILESPGEIAASIRSNPRTPRRCKMEPVALKEVRDKIARHVRNTYLKQVNAPMTAPELKLAIGCS